MEQQNAKNLITLEKFLDSLQDIISGFKSYVDSTNKRIDNLDKTINELAKRVNENTSITRETKKDSLNKLDNLSRQINTQDNDWSSLFGDLVKEIKGLQTEIKSLKAKSSDKPKKGSKTEPTKKVTKSEKK